MKIIADKEGRKKVEELCDLALRGGGLQNLKEVNKILESVEDIEEKEPDG